MLNSDRVLSKQSSSKQAVASSASENFAMAAMEEGDLILSSSTEVNLDSQEYEWNRYKHRPRKPQYLNHVHTGYEWNRYNQTHYDGENPPPESVQGYKFNIFYPDLILKSKVPS